MALVGGLLATLSADFFRLLVVLGGPEDAAEVAARFLDTAGAGSLEARGGSSWICPAELAEPGNT